jgi:hypothetical protein
MTGKLKYWSLFRSNMKGIQNYLLSNCFHIRPLIIVEKSPYVEKGMLIHFRDVKVIRIERDFKDQYDYTRHTPCSVLYHKFLLYIYCNHRIVID